MLSKTNTNACVKIKEILKDYGDISGQSVNLDKSVFQITINVSLQENNVLKNILHIKPSGDLETYLGCPIINGRENKNVFDSLVTNSKE